MHEDMIKKMKMLDRNNNAHSIQQMHAPRVKLPVIIKDRTSWFSP